MAEPAKATFDTLPMRAAHVYKKDRFDVSPRSRGPVLAVIAGLIVLGLYGFHAQSITPFSIVSGDLALSKSKDNWLASNSSEFRWSDIPPSTSLQYTPCFTSFQCARLSVPLNWNASAEEQESGPRAAIAVIKLPAKVPVTDPRYGGPIVINPGGPGESGVYQAIADGKYMQTIVDSPEAPANASSNDGKYFDILSFDPRGVNNTTPKLRCFPNAFNQQAWLLGYVDYGLLWSSESIIGHEWAKAYALGASCAQQEADGGILRYINTAQVAGDMVHIIEKEGEWRAAEAQTLIADLAIEEDDRKDEITKRTAYRAGEEKLQYWGMSYGTLIGSTFAALHPGRIGRVILDGVVDPADHYAGNWMTNLIDSDKVPTRFSEYCFQAGPEKCPLYTGSSPIDIETRYTSILLSLKKSPIPIILPPSDDLDAGPELITYGDAHLFMLSSMYFTFSITEIFWDMLLALENRNSTSTTLVNLAAGKQANLSPSQCFEEEDARLPYPCIPYNSMLGPNQAIGCMDIGGDPHITREKFADYLGVLETQSRWISPSWARNKLGCLGYGVQPAWRPEFTFQKQEWENTSHPLLLIGNSHDPVTPLTNARRVSTLFPGSVVLHQDSEGHCSQSNPSLCTARVIREYFQAGNLPPEGSTCEPEIKPFVGCINEAGCNFNAAEKHLWDSMVELADPFGLRKTYIPSSDMQIAALNRIKWHRGLHIPRGQSP